MSIFIISVIGSTLPWRLVRYLLGLDLIKYGLTILPNEHVSDCITSFRHLLSASSELRSLTNFFSCLFCSQIIFSHFYANSIVHIGGKLCIVLRYNGYSYAQPFDDTFHNTILDPNVTVDLYWMIQPHVFHLSISCFVLLFQ